MLCSPLEAEDRERLIFMKNDIGNKKTMTQKSDNICTPSCEDLNPGKHIGGHQDQVYCDAVDGHGQRPRNQKHKAVDSAC